VAEKVEVADKAEEIPHKRVILTLNQTDDEDGDVAQLRNVVTVLKEHPGQDEINLRVAWPGTPSAFSSAGRRKRAGSGK